MAPATTAHAQPGAVLVMGAGAIGCYVGGCLAAAGVPVTLVGRPRMLQAIGAHGLILTDRDGGHRTALPSALRLSPQVPSGQRPALVLLCVKSGATAEAAAQLGAALPAGTLVLSLQNGVSNAAVAAAAAPELQVLPAMVPYNVAELGPGAFHRGTAGRLVALEHAALFPWLCVFARAGVPLDLSGDLVGVQWGKLLLNLNNPVNALSGLPLREELMQRGYRRCLAALMDEAIAALREAGIVPAQLAAMPPHRLPTILRLPTPIFRLVAARMLRIDAKARSSMADDLALGRRTEIDAFCGEVVRLAEAHGGTAPRNAKMVELLHAWTSTSARLSAQQLQSELGV